jgi:chromosome segregation ATPase
LALSGCGTGADSSTEFATDSAVGAATETRSDSTAQTSSNITPQIIRTAALTIRVPDIDKAVADVREATAAVDGVITSEDFVDLDGEKNATVIVKVPAEKLDAFLTSLGGFGSVQQSNVTASDVTTQVIDLDARISALEASIARLSELQAQAETVADLIAVEAELANRQAELESIQSQRDYLGDQVAMSNVSIYLQSALGGVTQPDFLRGLANGFNALLNTLGGLVVAAGFLLPFGVVVLVIFLVVRAVQKRRRGRGQPPTGPNP